MFQPLGDRADFSISQLDNMWVTLPIIHDFDLLPATYREKCCYPNEMGLYHVTLTSSKWFNMGLQEYFWRKADAENVR